MSEEPKLNILAYQYPKVLLIFPRLIRIIYIFNFATQLRKIYVMRAWKRLVKASDKAALIADFGAGEAQYLVPFCNSYPQKTFYALDNRDSNILFYEALGYSNLKASLVDLEHNAFTEQADLGICVGVMQYLENDMAALLNIYQSLKPGATLLLYVPINGIILTAVYKQILIRWQHYETINKRKRVYSEDDLLFKLKEAGFSVQHKTYTYGYFGKLSHEILNSLSTIIFSGTNLLKIIAVLLFPICFPFIICFMGIDFILPKTNGNGVLLELKKGVH